MTDLGKMLGDITVQWKYVIVYLFALRYCVISQLTDC